MAAALGTLSVKGLRDLQKAFKLADKMAHRELRATLREVAEPVRADAEQLARGGIRKIGIPWSQMRVGVTQNLVYVVPKQRGRKSKANPRIRRPNLAPLLLDVAMEPALEKNRAKIEASVERMLDEVGRVWERA